MRFVAEIWQVSDIRMTVVCDTSAWSSFGESDRVRRFDEGAPLAESGP
jgi:hypothetical protein